MSGHAKLSPSAASRWMTCSGSVVLSEGMPEKSSAFAEEGTQAHALAEAMLRTIISGNDGADVEVAQEHLREAPEGMSEHVDVYVDHVCGLFAQPEAVALIEQRVHVNEDVYGTADAVVWQPDAHHLHIVDLKYGAGVPVEVHDNLQLRIYALAALLTFKYAAHQVTATIVQPRCPHSAGPVRSVTFDVVDLLDFHAELADAVRRVKYAQQFPSALGPWLKPTEKGCRRCLAAPKCPAIKSKAQAMAKQVFAPGLPYDPLELARTLDFLPIVEGWIKNTREFAYAEAERGHDIPDYKLVDKDAKAKWKSGIAEELAKLLGVPIDDLYEEGPKPLKGIGDITKLAPGKNDKERRKVLDPFVVKESSGHTLVHTSDKRPAIKVDAKSAFGAAP